MGPLPLRGREDLAALVPWIGARRSQACDLHFRIAFPDSSWELAGPGQPVDVRTGS